MEGKMPQLFKLIFAISLISSMNGFANCLLKKELVWGEKIQSKMSENIQGITHDDLFWYISNKYHIYKTQAYLNFSAHNYSNYGLANVDQISIPKHLAKKGYDHFGGISISGDDLVVALERVKPMKILFFDKSTLVLKFEYDVPLDLSSLSWVAANDHFIYFSRNKLGPDSPLFRLNKNNLSLKRFTFPADFSLKRIQGGTIDSKNNQLIFASDDGVKKGGIFTLNLKTLKLKKVLTIPYKKYFPFYQEIEGLTYWPKAHLLNPGLKENLYILMLNNNLFKDSFKLLQYCL